VDDTAKWCERCGALLPSAAVAVGGGDDETSVREGERAARASILAKMREDEAQMEESIAREAQRLSMQLTGDQQESLRAARAASSAVAAASELRGWLHKKGDLGLLRTWKHRYFVLKGGASAADTRLFYYKSEEQTSSVGGHMGYVALKDVMSVDRHTQKPNGFSLVTPERIYVLHASSAADESRWVTALRDVIESAKRDADASADELWRSNLPITRGELAPFSGWLLKEKLFGYARRWVVVRDGMLLSFREQGSTSGARKYPLYHVRIEDHARDPNAFQIVSTAGHAVFRCEDSADVDAQMHMFEWLNVILKHSIMIEEMIDSIEI
jgi:PH domain